MSCINVTTRHAFNPEHLFLGTQKDNMEDMVKKGRYTPRELPRGEKHPSAKLTAGQVYQAERTL